MKYFKIIHPNGNIALLRTHDEHEIDVATMMFDKMGSRLIEISEDEYWRLKEESI